MGDVMLVYQRVIVVFGVGAVFVGVSWVGRSLGEDLFFWLIDS